MIINTNTMSAAQMQSLQKELVQKAGPISPGRGEVHIDTYLTNLSVAVMQDPMGFVADMVSPGIPVQKQSGNIAVIDRSSYTRDVARPRAPGSESVGTGHKVIKESYDAQVHALHEDIDDQTRANYDMPLDADDDAMFVLAEMMKINREINWSGVAMKTANWDSYVTGATTRHASYDPSHATAANHQIEYLTNSASDPISIFKELRLHLLLTGGRAPTHAVFGATLFDKLCEHPDIVARVNQGQTPGEPAQATAMDLARLFRLQGVYPMEGVYNSAIEGATADYDFINDAESGLLLFVNPQAGGIRMPQAIRRLDWTGYLGANREGYRVKKFRMENIESERVEFATAYDYKIIDSGMGLYLNNVVG